jgi:hypothetical protein
MKQTRLMKILATSMACVVAATVLAQTSSTTTTTSAGGTEVSTTKTTDLSGSGTVTTYTPGSDSITFRSETSTEPVKYYYTKKTVLVDPNGKVVEWTALRPDMPVTYTYVKEGDRMVVTRVTLAKPVEVYKKEETTTTTTTTKP